MPRSPESGSSDPENSAEKQEKNLETTRISFDLTINKALMERTLDKPNYIEFTDIEGEADTLRHTLEFAILLRESDLERVKTGPPPRMGDEEAKKQEIAYIERSIENLKSIIEKFKMAIKE